MAEGDADFTTCSICLDTFDEPRILPCGHSFCTACLKNIIGGGNMTCPECRENIPNIRAEEFPKNYSLIDRNPNTELCGLQSVEEVTRVEQPESCYLAVFDSTSDHCFVLYPSKRVGVYNLKMHELYNFELQIEGVVIDSIAISGNGTVYVNYEQGEQKSITSAVDKKNGNFLRHIHTDNNYFMGMSALGNRLVIAYGLTDRRDTVIVSVYDNETLTKTLQLNIYSIYGFRLASLDYLLGLQRESNRVQLVISNIANSNLSQKSVDLKGLKYDYDSPFVWIGNKSCNSKEDTSGYLFIADYASSPNRPLVFEIDLSTVEDGSTLLPLNIPFTLKEKHETVVFLSAVGKDSIMSRLSEDGKDKLAMLRMDFG